MSLEFACTNPECEKALSISDEYAGKKIRCPGCRAVMTAPLPGDVTAVLREESEPSPSSGTKAEKAALQEIGEYEIVDKLGQGGMGAVFEAVHVKLGRKVALKVLNRKLTENPNALARFRREAKSAAAMNHPNIIGVYDIGEDQGTHYFSMEFVDGESVQERIKREGQLSPRATLEIVESVAKALQYAHERSFIHRDIKPENIMLTSTGDVKLADLGLAKSLEDDIAVTATGTGLGTPYYMAPEQSMDAAHADHRADIYALGITTLHMATGKRPFDGKSALEIVKKHLQDPLPTGEELGTALPEGIERIIRKMCAKDKEDRYPDYAELLDDLRAVREGETPAEEEEAPEEELPAEKDEGLAEERAAPPEEPETPAKPKKRKKKKKKKTSAERSMSSTRTRRSRLERAKQASGPNELIKTIAIGVAIALVIAAIVMALLAGGG